MPFVLSWIKAEHANGVVSHPIAIGFEKAVTAKITKKMQRKERKPACAPSPKLWRRRPAGRELNSYCFAPFAPKGLLWSEPFVYFAVKYFADQ